MTPTVPTPPIRIRRATDPAEVQAAAALFDEPPLPEATERFLASPGHHLLLAYDGVPERAIGFVSGVETTHPDKGTEMFLAELGVSEDARSRGTGTALTRALERLARERGCHGMWTATEADNVAALATYRRAGASEEESVVSLAWTFPSREAG